MSFHLKRMIRHKLMEYGTSRIFLIIEQLGAKNTRVLTCGVSWNCQETI